MIKANFLGFLIASLVRNLSIKGAVEWSSQTAYSIGDLCLSGNNKYISQSNSVSGFTAPTHTSGEKTDGGIMWQYVESVNSAYPNAAQLYLGIGTASSEDSGVILDGTLYAKKLSQTNVRLGKTYIKWQDNITIPAGSLVLNSVNEIFFVVVSGGLTEIEPSERGEENFKNSDGYVWRYVSTVSTTNQAFITEGNIPIDSTSKDIKTGETYLVDIVGQSGIITQDIKLSNTQGCNISFDLSPEGVASAAWVSQSSYENRTAFRVIGSDKAATGSGAVVSAIASDSVTSVSIDSAGVGYKDVTIIVDGDGSGAKLEADVDSLGSITGIRIIEGGSGYSFANIHVIPGKSGIVFGVTVKDIAIQSILNNFEANTVLINVSLYDVEGYLADTDNYNFVSLLANPSNQSLLNLAGDLNPADGLNRLDKQSSIVLWADTFDTKQRSAGQEENITIEIKLVE